MRTVLNHLRRPSASSTKRRQPFVPPVFLVNAAFRLRRFFLRAADAVVPAYVGVIDRYMGVMTTTLIRAAARLRIADHLASGPLEVGELAARTGTSADVLERTLQALVALGVFRRESDGRFANNRVSLGLTSDAEGGSRGWAEFFGADPVVRAFADLPATLRDGVTAFNRVHGRSVWDWLAAEPEAGAAFIEGMSAMTRVAAPSIVAAYPFDDVKTVCDVGGNVGIVLTALLHRYPHLRGVLFDAEAMLGGARAHLEKSGVADRVQLVAGSFFEDVPRGADAYLLKSVLHDWNDQDSLRILRNCRAAMDPGHRLLVVDFIDREDALITLVPFLDIMSLLLCGGRERTPDAMAKLFTEAGFRFGRLLPLPGGLGIFEAVAVA